MPEKLPIEPLQPEEQQKVVEHPELVKIPKSALKPEGGIEKKEKIELTIEAIKTIISSQIADKAEINKLDLIEVPEGVRLSVELDAGLLGGKILVEGLIVNAGRELAVSNLSIDARGYVKSRIESSLSNFTSAIKQYFEKQHEKPVSSIQIVGPTLVVQFEKIEEETEIESVQEQASPEKKIQEESEKKSEGQEEQFEKAEFEKIEEKFELKEAIQDKGFFDFLTEYAPENIEALDAAEIEKFQEAYKTSNEIKNFYKDVIEKDTGITLGDKDLKSLDAYFATQKDVDVNYIKEIREFSREFYALPERITEKEKVFADLGGKEAIDLAKARVDTNGLLLERKGVLLGQLEKKKELSKEVHGFRGFILLNNWPILGKFFRTQEEEEAYQKSTEEWRQEVSNLNTEINKLSDEMNRSREFQENVAKVEEELAAAKDKADALKNFFLQGGFEPAKNIFDITKEKLKQRISVVADPNRASIKDLEKGLEEVKKLSTTEIVKFTDTELKGFEKQINDALEYKVSSEIVEKLEKMPISKIGPLRAVDELVSQYFKKGKIGSKTKRQEIEELIKKSLLQYIKKTKPEAGETPQSFKAKKIAVKLMILQMEYVG